MPVIAGFVIAFVLNVPMRGLERFFEKLFSRAKRRPKKKLLRLVSLILTIILLILVVFLVCTLVFPAVADSVSSLYSFVLKKWPEWANILDDYGINTAKIGEWLNGLDIKTLVSRLTNSAGFIISSAASAVSGIITGVVSFFMSTVVALYVLMSKDDLARQVNLSKFFLCHLFEEEMGIPPKQYILQKRMAYAAKLIREGHPPTRVALQVGYASYSTFYRLYRKHFGKTPRS